ncbi:sodium:solute symporter family protein [Lentibacillus cibarius]|uniref:Sodium:solute symporter family protein n=1 Tax=Lentibacillus cibarius TaxID=2583219 RepID=A0A5S3QIN1_9BACI|nr:sodium:solute symporter family protein [Lentibacillus cibarius]TMN21725.1 sodium:solute symporter family protein [Lentibacillus cibarius]
MNWWLVWIIAFLVVLFSISITASRKIKTADDYVMANFSLGFFPICGSVIATVTGSAALIGGAGKGFHMGISYITTMISFTLFTIVAVTILGVTIRKLKLYTVPELFMRRFGKMAALIPALIIGLLYMTPTFGMQLVGMSSILSSVMDIPVIWGIILGFFVAVIFTLLGGMPSVAWTDAIQTVVILFGVILTLVLGVSYVGGPSEVIEHTPKRLFNFFDIGFKGLLNWFLVFGPFYIVWQTTWQRLTAAKTTRIGVWSIIIGFIISAIVGFLGILVGITAVQQLAPNTDPDLVYTKFLVDVFPPALGGLFLVSLLAALLTGATSFLLSGAINISKDIYQGWVNPAANDSQVLKVSRLSVTGMAILGLFIALFINDVIAIYQLALSFTAATLVMPVLAAMFWARATKIGVLTSIIGSIIVSLAWNLAGKPFGIHEILPGLIVSFLLLVVVSLLTKHSHDEEVTAYYYKFKNEKDDDLEEFEDKKQA